LFPKVDAKSVTSLNPQHEIHAVLHRAPLIVVQSYNRDEVARILSQRVLNLLFKHESQLALETYVLLLERICENSKKVSKEVFNWLLFYDDDQKYNLATFITILQARLLSVTELDMQLARLIDAGRVPVLEFSTRLIRRCLMEEPVLATQSDFYNCVDMYTRLIAKNTAPERYVCLIDG
jgi:CCR4-NOT transcription complex subunit 1